ncbi:MAG TPA: polyprenyl synthetase family protein, partial [Gammaproteobacteria bacterium]|nr:polyprenyl synthetase family protein [Gammaproteobacteria bacterium]
IRASVLLAAQGLPGLDAGRLKALDHYAKCVGLAFQIRDDILDVEGETATLGKRTGADSALNKPTYPSVLGLEKSKHRAIELKDDALESLVPFGETAVALRWLAEYIVEREN